jgi:hypothetical protein
LIQFAEQSNMAPSGREIHDHSDRDERGTEPQRYAVRWCGGCSVDESELLQKKPEPRYHEAESHQRKTGANPCQKRSLGG